MFALPAMSADELAAFRKAQGDVRDALVVPVVVAAVADDRRLRRLGQMRDPGHLGPAAGVRLGGSAVVLLPAGRRAARAAACRSVPRRW